MLQEPLFFWPVQNAARVLRSNNDSKMTTKEKLQSLVSYLCQVTQGFETIAEDIECTNLRTAIFTLSVEARQYAEEITDQLRELNITIPSSASDQLWKKIETDIHEQASFSKGGEIAALCNNCEIHHS